LSCRRQFSRYTCPSCNVPYCSLTCFRSEAHSQCSETFYRKEVETGIKTESSKTAEERVKILELLKRIEEQSIEEDEMVLRGSDEDEDEDEDEDDLAQRLGGVDISSASANDMLGMLTKQERDKFFMALRDPSSELAQRLLASAELHKIQQEPWWEAPSVSDESSLPLHVRYGHKPDLMEVPDNLIKQYPGGPSLLYNICAVLLAYSYTTRHMSMSPLSSTTNDAMDKDEARRVLSQTVPFITHPKSKVLHGSLRDAAIMFWSRFDPGGINTKIMLVLMEDVEKLVRPRRVTKGREGADSDGRSPQCDNKLSTIMAISDVASLFKLPTESSAVSQRSHVVMKLTFYAAHLLSTPSFVLHALADDVYLLSESMESEVEKIDRCPAEAITRPEGGSSPDQKTPRKGIAEIS
ncbi:hypothetical protein BU15DRAFT_54862, partial [Melanogaster broomeanus]